MFYLCSSLSCIMNNTHSYQLCQLLLYALEIRKRNFFPINAPGMGRFQLPNLGVLGYGLELRFWVVIAIIVSLTLTITLIHSLTTF